MRRIVVGACDPGRILRLADPDEPTEPEFEYCVAQILTCLYPQYHCIVFSGGFLHDGQIFKPDLALIARDCSHWFVIEVELLAHSFDGHVLPQVRAFRYGTPVDDCISQISKSLKLDRGSTETLVFHVPRNVVVIANGRNRDWELQLKAHNIQFLSAYRFRAAGGDQALELDGEIEVYQESLGIGLYVATDRSIRLGTGVKLPDGEIQIDDPAASVSIWTVSRDLQHVWVTKKTGLPAISHNSYVQLLRTIDGRVALKRLGP